MEAKYSPEDGATVQQRLDDLMLQLKYMPEDSAIVTGHSLLFRRLLGDSASRGFVSEHPALAQRLRRRKIPNCGVVELALDFALRAPPAAGHPRSPRACSWPVIVAAGMCFGSGLPTRLSRSASTGAVPRARPEVRPRRAASPAQAAARSAEQLGDAGRDLYRRALQIKPVDAAADASRCDSPTTYVEGFSPPDGSFASRVLSPSHNPKPRFRSRGKSKRGDFDAHVQHTRRVHAEMGGMLAEAGARLD